MVNEHLTVLTEYKNTNHRFQFFAFSCGEWGNDFPEESLWIEELLNLTRFYTSSDFASLSHLLQLEKA